MERKGKEKGRGCAKAEGKGGRTGRESKGIGDGGGKAPSPRILATPLPLAIADRNPYDNIALGLLVVFQLV